MAEHGSPNCHRRRPRRNDKLEDGEVLSSATVAVKGGTICNGSTLARACALALGRPADRGHGGRAMILCAAGVIRGALDRLYEDFLAFERRPCSGGRPEHDPNGPGPRAQALG